MRHFSDETVYFISYAKLPENISVAKLHHVVGIGLIINYKTGVVEDISCTLLTEEAKFFLKDVIVGFNAHDDDVETLVKNLCYRYHGMSQKAITVALKGSLDRYMLWKTEQRDIDLKE